ncbi:MAG: alanine dehydrogenase [Bacteroidetes bacterium]|nr:alanine dehydrogenase [Bacteroidota bacterium]
MVEVRKRAGGLRIGVPKEIAVQENRIALTPQAVHLLVAHGHEVWVETGAGLNSKFTDHDFSEAGALVVEDAQRVYSCPYVVKVAFPTTPELDILQQGQTLISTLHAPLADKSAIDQLMRKKITAIGMEMLKDETGGYPVVQSMSEIAGGASILIASEYLSNIKHGKGVMLGGISGIPPSEIVVIGAGTVGQYAARAALGLGATVKVFDNSVTRLKRLLNGLHAPIFTSIAHPKVLINALRTADVVIGAVRAVKGRAPVLVTEEMVMGMKPGSVIVDVSIDHGGCVETSEVTNHQSPVFEKHGVIHYCVTNIPSRVGRTASYALSNVYASFLLDIGRAGGVKNHIWEREYVRESVYLFQGMLTNDFLGEKFGIPVKDINLLIASLL